MEAELEELQAFASALDDALIARGLERKQFAHALSKEMDEPVNTSSVSQWATGVHEPARKRVFAMERVLGLREGALSVHLGYLPASARPARTVADAIEADTKLSPRDKAVLRSVYQTMKGT